MPPPSEDKRIVAARDQLEIHWRENLTDQNRADWRSRWVTRPPYDVAVRTYVTRPPQVMSEIAVTEPTCFAWSQIYGYLRFGLAPVSTPTNPAPITLELVDVLVSSASFYFRTETNADPQTGLRFILWASPVLTSGRQAPIYEVRPIGFYVPLTTPAEIDAINSYMTRFDAPTPGFVTVRAGLVNANNELAGLSPVVTVEVS